MITLHLRISPCCFYSTFSHDSALAIKQLQERYWLIKSLLIDILELVGLKTSRGRKNFNHDPSAFSSPS